MIKCQMVVRICIKPKYYIIKKIIVILAYFIGKLYNKSKYDHVYNSPLVTTIKKIRLINYTIYSIHLYYQIIKK